MEERRDRFHRLFNACYKSLQAHARRRCDPADVDDLVAEVLAVAWRRLDDIPTDFQLPWLFGVARRVLANQRRSRWRRVRLTDRVARQQLPNPGPGDDVGDRSLAAVAGLASLRADDQEVLRLAAWEDLRAAEIAVVLGCSTNAAALRLSRARRRLRDALTEPAPNRTGHSRQVPHG